MATGRFRRRGGANATALTLVEFLVILGLAGMLTGMVTMVCLKARTAARRTVCASNLRTMYQAYMAQTLDSCGALPPIYYTLTHQTGEFKAEMRTMADEKADKFFEYLQEPRALRCPSDTEPVSVLGRTQNESKAMVLSSYGYNMNLPVRYENSSRIDEASTTVLFYDGNPALAAGTWGYRAPWAEATVRHTHPDTNYVFLDGHVESFESFPEAAFDGGVFWLAFAVTSTPPPSGGGGGGGGGSPSEPESHTVTGDMDISANVSHLVVVMANGTTIDSNTLKDKNCPDFDGEALSCTIKPKGNTTGSILVDGEPYTLQNGKTYLITADPLTFRLYNSQRNGKGQPVGKWCLEIVGAVNAQVTQK